jgi:Raf kinase inhibitor-like YbhB/YbcL family protein
MAPQLPALLARLSGLVLGVSIALGAAGCNNSNTTPVVVSAGSPPPAAAVRTPSPPTSSVAITLTSTTFSDGGTLPAAAAFSGCGGSNVSPDLAWRGFPPNTQSFVLTVFDPDAPTGSGFWHWLLFNIPASVTSLPSNAGASATPAGAISGYTDNGFSHYGGPCPPVGDPPHRYIFTVYALDVATVPGASAATTGATLVFSIGGHVLAQGSIVGRYGR